jgi:hypothetical protein
LLLAAGPLAACNQCSSVLRDRCESLCRAVSLRLEDCLPASVTWVDLGARDRDEFAEVCRRDWDRTSADLTSNELELSLDLCAESCVDVDALTCDEVVALFAPM